MLMIMTKSEFILKARQVHGWKYDYSKVEDTVRSHTKICIICPKHGEFWQEPYNHLKGIGCKKCAIQKLKTKMTKEDFVKKAQEVHNNKYDYSKVNFENVNSLQKQKVCIICPEHGEFWQKPKDHLDGKGCKKCGHILIGVKKKKLNNDFIDECKSLFGNKYNYDKTIYNDAYTKVTITCLEHGDFEITPHNLLKSKYGCPICAKINSTNDSTNTRLRKDMSNDLSLTEVFIEKAKKVHGDKYDYSKVNYVDSRTKVCIICPKHGEFWQSPTNHLSGFGCEQCHRDKTGELLKKRLKEMLDDISGRTDKFIQRAKEIHGDKYDYSLVEYKNRDVKVCIICPKHGKTYMTPIQHLIGLGCHKCSTEKSGLTQRLTNEEFIRRAREIHGDKYDYSKSVYKGYHNKVLITCPKHGDFWQLPSTHFRGGGCPECSHKKKHGLEKADYNFLNTELFIKRAKELHSLYDYDYSKVNYVNIRKKVTIICPKHGEFKVGPDHFLYGTVTECPKCRTSKLGESVMNMLTKNNIDYKIECGGKTLKGLNKKRVDIYIPKLNIAIECQGYQHFSEKAMRNISHGMKGVDDQIKLDEDKYDILKSIGTDVLYYFPKTFNHNKISFYDDKKCFHNIEDLKEYILSKSDKYKQSEIALW